jgi:hypothetical protein
MKNILLIFGIMFFLMGCKPNKIDDNTSALDEQRETEINQKHLLAVQPPPKISWSLERDNLIKRFKLQNDRTIMFYMYIFIEGDRRPIGYYQVNKVSSVNSQLTNTEQVVPIHSTGVYSVETLPSPAEDGSYGTNGDGVFGFTPNDIYIEHNMKYIVSTVMLSFPDKPFLLTSISVKDEEELKKLMEKIKL